MSSGIAIDGGRIPARVPRRRRQQDGGSYQIIQRLGGDITFTRRSGEGTRFVIRLPIKLPETK